MIKDNASIRNFCYRIFRVCNISSVIDNFCNTLCTGDTHGDHDKNHGEHHEVHHNVHAVVNWLATIM